jgi:hypothetical protein
MKSFKKLLFAFTRIENECWEKDGGKLHGFMMLF